MMKLRLIPLVFLWLVSSYCIAETLVIRTGLEEASKGFQIARSLADEIQRRTDLTIDFIHLPAKRSLNYLESGIIDGEWSRVANFGTELPGLIRISEPVATHYYIAYTINKDIVIDSWESLKPYSVAYLRGWTVIDNKLGSVHNNLIPVNSVEAGLNFITAGRADVFVSIPFFVDEVLNHREWKGSTIRALQAPVDSLNVYIYLLPKHAVAGIKIVDALKSMKADQSYDEIINGSPE